MNKIHYDKPITELLVVRFEEGILQASITGLQSFSGDDVKNDASGWGNDY